MLLRWAILFINLGRMVLGGVVFCNSTSDSSFRLWQTLNKLVVDQKLLQELYPAVTGLNDDIEDEDSEESLVLRIQSMLQLIDEDMAALLPLYYNLNPGSTYGDSGENFFLLNGKRYDEADDVFYLKSRDLEAQRLVPDHEVLTREDTIIGQNENSPLIVLYGCDLTEEFEDLNRNLYIESSAGKIRFVWRGTCPYNSDFELMASSTSLTIKKNKWGQKVAMNLSLPAEFSSPDDKYTISDLSKDQLSKLDLKVATLIASKYADQNDFDSTWIFFKQLVNNFPIISKSIAALDNVDNRLVEHLSELAEKGIDHTMLGLYINGQYMRITDLSPWSLVDAVSLELQQCKIIALLLDEYCASADEDRVLLSKELISRYSQHSLFSIQATQPVKYDLHRIPGFSESIIYFNDIETDSQYNNTLKNDLSEFFKKSEFGELPAFKENWNEIIFVIDLSDLSSKDSSEALAGMLRALDVVKNGYPQRIGFLPLSNLESSKGTLSRIYELKDRNLNDLIDFLKELSNSRHLVESDFDVIPPVQRILSEDLKINATSIIINGEIYFFKANNWNYLVAQVIKKDVAILKNELRKIKKTGEVSVRSLLHSKSFTTRNEKYLPDYFQDSTYFTTALKSLDLLGDRVINIVKNGQYSILHTVTLVDDFSTTTALERFLSLFQTNLLGVRYRLIHRGPFDAHWEQVRHLVQTQESKKITQLLKRMKSEKPKNVLGNSILRQWLVGCDDSFLNQSSFMIINGRYLHFEEDEIPTTSDFESIIRREAVRTLDAVLSLEEIIPDCLLDGVNPDLIETLSASLTKLFYDGSNIYHNGIDYTAESTISRTHVGKMLDGNPFGTFQTSDLIKPVDVIALLDPLEERTQKILTVLSLVKNLPFVNLQISLMPTEDLTVYPIHRVWVDDDRDLPEILHQTFDFDVDVPENVHVTRDFDGRYDVAYIKIEVHAFDEHKIPSKANVEGIANLCLKLVDDSGHVVATTITMATFGYGLLRVKEFGRNFTIESCSDEYVVTSYSIDGRSDYVPSPSFDVTSFEPKRIHVKVSESGFSQRQSDNENDDINIFSIITGLEDEEDYQQMIFVASQECLQPIKFWIIGTDLTPNFVRFLKMVSAQDGCQMDFEFISYDWPRWLRPQRFHDREINAVKIMMLDILFPKDVHKLIYLHPAARLQNIQGLAEYKFDTVFSLPKAYARDGHPYWKEGHWKKFIESNDLTFYAMKPAFIVNMDLYRQNQAGDKLRIHYQRISSDINSLTNVDQDLINDIQLELPITLLSKHLISKMKLSAKSLQEYSNLHSQFMESLTLSGSKTNPFDQTEQASITHDEL